MKLELICAQKSTSLIWDATHKHIAIGAALRDLLTNNLSSSICAHLGTMVTLGRTKYYSLLGFMEVLIDPSIVNYNPNPPSGDHVIKMRALAVLLHRLGQQWPNVEQTRHELEIPTLPADVMRYADTSKPFVLDAITTTTTTRAEPEHVMPPTTTVHPADLPSEPTPMTIVSQAAQALVATTAANTEMSAVAPSTSMVATSPTGGAMVAPNRNTYVTLNTHFQHLLRNSTSLEMVKGIMELVHQARQEQERAQRYAREEREREMQEQERAQRHAREERERAESTKIKHDHDISTNKIKEEQLRQQAQIEKERAEADKRQRAIKEERLRQQAQIAAVRETEEAKAQERQHQLAETQSKERHDAEMKHAEELHKITIQRAKAGLHRGTKTGVLSDSAYRTFMRQRFKDGFESVCDDESCDHFINAARVYVVALKSYATHGTSEGVDMTEHAKAVCSHHHTTVKDALGNSKLYAMDRARLMTWITRIGYDVTEGTCQVCHGADKVSVFDAVVQKCHNRATAQGGTDSTHNTTIGHGGCIRDQGTDDIADYQAQRHVQPPTGRQHEGTRVPHSIATKVVTRMMSFSAKVLEKGFIKYTKKQIMEDKKKKRAAKQQKKSRKRKKPDLLQMFAAAGLMMRQNQEEA